MTIENRRLLRDAFGTFMTGVTVVTTTDADGQPQLYIADIGDSELSKAF